MRDALRSFRPVAPRMMGWWVVATSPAVFLVMWGTGRADALGALVGAVAMVPAGIPLLPLIWLAWFEDARPTRRRLGFAALWALVTFVPAGLVVGLIASAADL